MKLRHVASVLVLLSGCGPKPDAAPPAPTPPQDVAFTASEFAFTGPDSIAPGMSTVHFVNSGKQEHHLILAMLDSGKTVTDLMAVMQKTPNAQPAWFKAVGVAGGVEPGDSTSVTVDLAAGHYVALCFLSDPTDGKMHIEKGMMKELHVAGTAHVADAPKADVEVKLMDFAFEVPAITAGKHTFHLVNSGVQDHEAQLVRINDGVDLKTFMAAMKPGAKAPPPGKMAGGPGALSSGKENYWTTTLTAGHYVFICFVPDSANGTPHAMKGMVKEFTIQ